MRLLIIAATIIAIIIFISLMVSAIFHIVGAIIAFSFKMLIDGVLLIGAAVVFAKLFDFLKKKV